MELRPERIPVALRPHPDAALEGTLSRRGMSLVELIVALALFAVIATALCTLFPASFLSIRRAEAETGARSQAQSLLEQRRCLRFDQLVPGTPETLPVAALGSLKFERQFQVVELRPGVKQLRATVAWTVRGVRRQVVETVVVADVPR
ncbi:MAG: type II secretion system protein [Candidatus Eremiobacterota bacterium]